MYKFFIPFFLLLGGSVAFLVYSIIRYIEKRDEEVSLFLLVTSSVVQFVVISLGSILISFINSKIKQNESVNNLIRSLNKRSKKVKEMNTRSEEHLSEIEELNRKFNEPLSEIEENFLIEGLTKVFDVVKRYLSLLYVNSGIINFEESLNLEGLKETIKIIDKIKSRLSGN